MHSIVKRHDIFIWIPIILFPLITLNITVDPVLPVRFTILAIFLTGFSLYFLIKKDTLKIKSSYSVNILILTIIAFVLYNVFSIIISPHPGDALFEFLKLYIILLTGILFYIYYNDNSYKFLNNFVISINILTIIISIWGIYNYIYFYSSTELTHAILYEIRTSFAHKNLFTEVLLLCIPFTAYAAFYKTKWLQILGVTNTIFVTFLIIALLTRAVWVAFFAGIVFFCICYIIVFIKEKNKQMLWRISPVVISLLVVISISANWYLTADVSNPIKKQVIKTFNTEYGSVKDRIVLWKKTYKLIKEKPFFGHGTASWRTKILKYGNKDLRSQDHVTFYQRPHNDYLWIASENGFTGLVLYLLLFLMVGLMGLKLIFNKENPVSLKIYVLILLSAMVGYLTYSVFSFPKERIIQPLLICLMAAIIFSLNKNKKTLKLRRVHLLTLFIPVYFSLFFGFVRINSEICTRKIYKARENQQWKKVMNLTPKTVNIFYKMDAFSTPIKWYSGNAWYNLGNIEYAVNDYEEAYQINPYHIHILNNLGTCYSKLNRNAEAIKYYEQALTIAPNFRDAILNLSAIYYNKNKHTEAYKVLRKDPEPPSTKRFIHTLRYILKPFVEDIVASTSEKPLKKQFIAIFNTPEWTYGVHKKSIQNQRSFRDQLYIDAIYTLTEIDSVYSSSFADSLTLKYHIKP
jgi:O-antigen ligase